MKMVKVIPAGDLKPGDRAFVIGDHGGLILAEVSSVERRADGHNSIHVHFGQRTLEVHPDEWTCIQAHTIA